MLQALLMHGLLESRLFCTVYSLCYASHAQASASAIYNTLEQEHCPGFVTIKVVPTVDSK